MRTTTQSARLPGRRASSTNQISTPKDRASSAPVESKALRLDCILLDAPRHNKELSNSHMKKSSRQASGANIGPRLRPPIEENASLHTITARNIDATSAIAVSQRASRKRRASPPHTSIPQRNRHHAIPKAGLSNRRMSPRNAGDGLLTAESSTALEQSQCGLEANLNDPKGTPRPRKRTRFLDAETSSLGQGISTAVPHEARSSSPEPIEPGAGPRKTEEDVLMTDFQLLSIPDLSCLPWVPTTVPLLDGLGNACDTNVFLPPGVRCIVQSMRHYLAMEHAARQKAEERCEQETRLRVNAERQVAALEADIARLEKARKAWLATTAETLASNLTKFSQSLLGKEDSKPLHVPPSQHHQTPLMTRNSDVKGKGRMLGASTTELV